MDRNFILYKLKALLNTDYLVLTLTNSYIQNNVINTVRFIELKDNCERNIARNIYDKYHKSNIIYGIHEARNALGKIKQLIIVEGYMDVVALAQHGIENVVATLGRRSLRGIGRSRPRRHLCRESALAVPEPADDRLPCLCR